MKSLKLLPFVFCFLFFGCEDLVDCIFNKRPEIPNKYFEAGFVNSYYYEEFTSEVKNDPRDDDYDYFYEIYGDLPDGLEMYANYRTLSIEGMPLTSGTFTFTVHLFVDPPEYYDEDSGRYEDSLCSDSTSKEFSITIN
ncbi:hypothetical protein [Winogradskyella sp.]|uniref:hypothetical protein n=1 Tax=Winogradskyella sp. TaxID=1883156 RepID=UPI0025DEE107|nr:hypothetical protein [Winogradskyella sp.]